MLGILAAVFAYFLFALGNIFEKIFRSNHMKSPYTILLLNELAMVPLLLIPIFHILGTNSYLYVALSITAGALSTTGFFLYLLALKKEEASKLVALWNIAPLMVLALAFFLLQERLPTNFYVAFGLIFLGSVMISVKYLKGLGSRGFYLMLLSNFLYALAAVIAKYVLGTTDFLDYMFYFGLGNSIFAFFLLIPNSTREVLTKDTRDIGKKRVLIFYLMLILIAWPLYLFSIQQLPVSIAAVLGGMQSAFVFIIALFLSFRFPKTLKENMGRETITLKIVSILLMLAGLYLLGMN